METKQKTPVEKRPRTPMSRFLLRAKVARGFQYNNSYYYGKHSQAVTRRYCSFVAVWNGFEDRPELYIK